VASFEAIGREDVFKPPGEVASREDRRIPRIVEWVEPKDLQAWIDEVQVLHRRILDRRGPLPDSTPEIAEDRVRDV